MRKLTKWGMLRIKPDTPVQIVHQEKGTWEDVADGVYTLIGDELHLSGTDTWLDCDVYESVWVAYVKE